MADDDYADLPELEHVPESEIKKQIERDMHIPRFAIFPESPSDGMIFPARVMQLCTDPVSERQISVDGVHEFAVGDRVVYVGSPPEYRDQAAEASRLTWHQRAEAPDIIDEWTGKSIPRVARAASYGATFASPNVVVGIAGIIGAGKSTLASALAARLGWDCIDEPVSNNPYLADFYKDKKAYGFAMQIFLLHHRFRQHQSMVWGARCAIQDRTIYEDVIFAKMLHESGDISDRDFETYCSAFANMSNFLHRPDIIVYLDVTPEVAHDRVVARARGCENGLVPIEYLRALRDGYEDWLASGIRGRIPVLRIDWSGALDVEGVAEKITTILAESRTSFIV